MSESRSVLQAPLSHTSRRFQSAFFAILSLLLSITSSILSKDFVVIAATLLGIAGVLALTYRHSAPILTTGLTGLLLMGSIVATTLSDTEHWLVGLLTAITSAITILRVHTTTHVLWVPGFITTLYVSLVSWRMHIGTLTPREAVIHGICLFIAAICLFTPSNVPLQDLTDPDHITTSKQGAARRIRRTLAGLALLGMAAVVVRMWNADQPTLFFDAPLHIDAAFDLIDGITPIYTRNIEYTWLIATSMQLFGESLGAIRLVNAIIGGLIVVLAGLITLRISRSPWAAWFTGFVLVLHPMEHYVSRMVRGYAGMHAGILLMILGAMVLVQPLRSLKIARTHQQIIGTLACALGALVAFRFHPLSSVIIILCAIAIGIILIGIRTPSRPKKILKALGLLVCTVLACGGVIAFALIGDVMIDSIAGRFLAIPENLTIVTLHHAWLLTWVPLPLVMLGVAALFLRIRKRHIFVFFLTSVIGIEVAAWFFAGAFIGARYITFSIPLLVILAAVGLHALVHTVQHSVHRWQGHPHVSVLSLLMGSVATVSISALAWHIAQPVDSFAMPTTPLDTRATRHHFLAQYDEVLAENGVALTQLQPHTYEGIIFSISGNEAYRSWARLLNLPAREILSANITGSTRSHDRLAYGPYINDYPQGYALFSRSRWNSGCGLLDEKMDVYHHCVGFRNVVTHGMNALPDDHYPSDSLVGYTWQHAPSAPAVTIPAESSSDIVAVYDNTAVFVQSVIPYKHSQKTLGYLIVETNSGVQTRFIIPSTWFSGRNSIRIPLTEPPTRVQVVIINERTHPDTWFSQLLNVQSPLVLPEETPESTEE